MLFALLTFALGIYLGHNHYEQFVELCKAGWTKLAALFKKKD